MLFSFAACVYCETLYIKKGEKYLVISKRENPDTHINNDVGSWTPVTFVDQKKVKGHFSLGLKERTCLYRSACLFTS